MNRFDITIFGATGFTGKLVVQYLLKNPGNSELSLAIAGRSKEKLTSLNEILGTDLPMVVADSNDPESLRTLAQQSKVVCSTVGPYSTFGSGLVEACVAQQTHYCDLAGEVHWIRKMIDHHHESASQQKVKIVHCCGFDSVPSDMGVYYLQKYAKEHIGSYFHSIKNGLRGMKGSISGGTYASMTAIQEAGSRDPSLYKILFHPYALNPADKMNGPDEKDLLRVVYDQDLKGWKSPFIMASINTRIVRRSHALAGLPYGEDFTYDEFTLHSDGLAGRWQGIRNIIPLALIGGAKPGSLRKKILDKYFPEAGDGPSEKERNRGYFNFKMLGMGANGNQMMRIMGDKDPGYGFTCRMMGEAAISLAKDTLPGTFGILTPSVALGDAYLRRLENNAGLQFKLQS